MTRVREVSVARTLNPSHASHPTKGTNTNNPRDGLIHCPGIPISRLLR